MALQHHDREWLREGCMGAFYLHHTAPNSARLRFLEAVSSIWAGSIFWNGALSKTFFYGVLLRGEMNMRALMVTFLAGAGALIASSAYAADEVQAGESSPLLHQARVVCNDTGQCWHSRGDRRVIIGDGYDGYYGSRRYYDYDRDYYREPGIGVYGPGFSFGIGRGW